MDLTAQEIKVALEEPFTDGEIKYRQGAYGKSLAYLDGPTVYRRLNDSTNSWSFVTDRSFFDDMVSKEGEVTKVMIVEGHLTIPELGTRAGTGVQNLKPGSGEDMYKGARTDAIKNAASLFGVGLHLYSDMTTDQSERGYGANQPQRPQSQPRGGDDEYVPSEMRYDPPNYQQGGGEQQGQYQRATGERVAGGATVKQINAIKAIAKDKGVGDGDLGIMAAEQTGGTTDLDQLTSRGASNIIGKLNEL